MTQASPPLSEPDLYRLVRAQVEFEDGLITQRLSWFVAAQSFLFTAYAIVLNGPPMVPGTDLWRQHRLVMQIIPVVAMASCVLIYLGIIAGTLAQRRLKAFLAARIAPEVLSMFPLIHGVGLTRAGGMAAPLGLPPVFVTVWIVIFAHGASL